MHHNQQKQKNQKNWRTKKTATALKVETLLLSFEVEMRSFLQ